MKEFDEFAVQVNAVCEKRSRFKSNLKHIYANLKSVDVGLKPSYLWDRSPFLSVDVIQRLVVTLSSKCIIRNSLTVFTLNNDVFVVNKQALLRLLVSPVEYYAFFDATTLNVMSFEDCRSVRTFLAEFREDLQHWEDDREFPVNDSWCIPCLYGVILGYPTVLWLPPGGVHSLDGTPLVNCKVNVTLTGFESEELYSFSHLPLEELSLHVNEWFLTLKRSTSESIGLTVKSHSVTSCSIAL